MKLKNFSEESARELAEGRRLIAYKECSMKELGLKALRKSFLLNPTADSAREISALYNLSKFRNDRMFYELYAASPAERKVLAEGWKKYSEQGDSSLTPAFVDRNADFFGTKGAR